MNIRNLPVTVFALTAMLVSAQTASAVTLGVALSDPYILGTAIPGITGGGGQAERDVTMTTNLLSIPLGATQVIDTLYHRSTNVFSPLPTPTATGSVIASAGDLAISGNFVGLTLTSQFNYLVAAWDGQNGGVAIYDIRGLASGTHIDLLRYAGPVSGVLTDGTTAQQYQMTGWTLLNPIEGRGDNVPDSGSMLILSGIAIVALGLARRFV